MERGIENLKMHTRMGSKKTDSLKERKYNNIWKVYICKYVRTEKYRISLVFFF